MINIEEEARKMQNALVNAIEAVTDLPPTACLDVLASLGLLQLRKTASDEMFDMCREDNLPFEEYMKGIEQCLECIAVTIKQYHDHCVEQSNQIKKERRHFVN